MKMEYMIRCAFWLGRLRAKAEADEEKEIMDMADMAADALADALADETVVRTVPELKEEDYA